MNSTDEDIQAYGRKLLNDNREAFESFEAVANDTVTRIYDDFLNPEGDRIFALLRIFKMVTAGHLPPEGQQDVPDSPQWLSLVATVGQEEAWNDRLQSEGHRLLPAGAFETPMLKAMFQQLGLRDDSGEFVKDAGFMANFFHVEEADGSPYIVVQDDFVKPFNIESVVGIGSPFLGGSMYVMVGFATTHLDTEQAQKFAKLSPFIGALMAYYEEIEKPVWIITG